MEGRAIQLQLQHDSLGACLAAEGSPLTIPLDEAPRLRHALYLRGKVRFGLGELRMAHSDLAESVSLGGDWPELLSLKAYIEQALVSIREST